MTEADVLELLADCEPRTAYEIAKHFPVKPPAWIRWIARYVLMRPTLWDSLAPHRAAYYRVLESLEKEALICLCTARDGEISQYQITERGLRCWIEVQHRIRAYEKERAQWT